MITRTWLPTGGTLDTPIFYPRAAVAGSRVRTEEPRRSGRRPSAISFYATLVVAGIGLGLVLEVMCRLTSALCDVAMTGSWRLDRFLRG